MSVFVWIVFGLAALPAVMTAWNLFHFRRLRPAPEQTNGERPRVSVLIPARDEEASIGGAVASVLESHGVDLEVIVLDDQSTDATPAIVRKLAVRDGRLKLAAAPPLPAGWCGKQHACHVLSTLATHERLVWIDADVRLAPDALRRMSDAMDRTGVGLLSGFPHQETRTWLEQLVVPLINIVLVAYLPMAMMRRSDKPGFGAGCGQLFMADRAAYQKAGGHAAIRGSMHDGVTLPRAFRKAGLMTDLFDAGDVATCRMYRDAAQVWRGFAKNATEGMATPIGIVVWTVLLLGGFVLPWVMIGLWAAGLLGATAEWQRVVLWGAWLMTAMTALGTMFRFDQPWLSAIGRPVGIAVLVAIQWYALGRKLLGKPSTWRGRAVGASA
jgi:cellulose synthase/poly-beta-1,6-N-acetylglucosamine synthase-like glycosyltransferase